MQIADNLYAYPWSQTTTNNCNTFVLAGQPLAMFDPGHAQLYGHVEMGLASDQLTQAPGLVIITHCHPDHLEAAGRLQAAGAKLAIHPTEAQYMEGEGRALAAAMGLSAPEISWDAFLDEGEVTIGGHPAQVLHTPGHSPGHICIYLPESKALVAGDLVFAQGVGRVDFPGGDGEALKESIAKVAALDIELLLPGHGPIVKGAESVKKNFQLIEQYYFPML